MPIIGNKQSAFLGGVGSGLKKGQNFSFINADPLKSITNAKSLDLDGTDEYTENESWSLISDYPFTISAWVKVDDFSGVGQIITFNDFDFSDSWVALFANDAGGSTKRLVYRVRDSGTFNTVGSDENLSALSTDTWYHVVGVSASSTDHKVYVDASLGGSDTTDLSLDPNPLSQFTVGARVDSNNSSGANFFNGHIKDVSVWSVALSQAEITELYNNGNPGDLTSHSQSSNLVSWWRMGDDENDDSTSGSGSFIDQTVNNKDLTPRNTEAGDIVSDTP